jgi:hypothetical protein
MTNTYCNAHGHTAPEGQTYCARCGVDLAPATPAYYSPVFFQGEDYDELVDILDAQGLDAAIQHAAQWDQDDEIDDNYRATISEFAHEREYGPVSVEPYAQAKYWLVVSQATACAYLVREAH